MKWTIHGERELYGNAYIRHSLADVELPDGQRFEHDVVRMRHLAVALMLNDRDEVLMLWRNRFVTGTWAWELPMGLIEPGEQPLDAALREAEEETGWRAGRISQLTHVELAAGITDSEHFHFLLEDPVHVGPPTEKNEAERLEWIALGEVRAMIDRGEIVSAASVVPLLRLLLARAEARREEPENRAG